MPSDLLIRHGTVLTADAVYAADIAITDGTIAAILAPGTSIEPAKQS